MHETPKLESYNYAILLEYDGSHFFGLQKQKSTEQTIQHDLEKSLFLLFKYKIIVNFAGRTDSGVHSTGMVANFQLNTKIPQESKFLMSLNSLTSKWLSIKKIEQVPLKFHACFSCSSREYKYMILNTKYPSPLLDKKVFWYPYPIDFKRFEEELLQLKGENDFRSLSKQKSNLSKQTKRNILQIQLENSFVENLFYISIRANGFLHNMIRTLVGTLLDISRGKIKESILEVLSKKDRKQAGINLPPHGLYFTRAYYDGFSCINNLYL